MTARSAGDNERRCFIQINTRESDPVSRGFVCFSRIQKMIHRTDRHTMKIDMVTYFVIMGKPKHGPICQRMPRIMLHCRP